MKSYTYTGVCLFVLLFTFSKNLVAQDPSYSQFFASPLNINPALTANINGDWRLISNFRDQWIDPASPYVSGSVSFDSKIFQRKIPNVENEKNILGIGTMLMYDQAMYGIQKSIYASVNMSYSIKLSEGDVVQRLTAGFGTTYGSRRIDFSRLDFESQFNGRGFNTSLPTGEAALSNMKGYFSLSSGLKYSYTTEKTNFDIGAAGFHLNSPKQTFLEDKAQEIPLRRVAHGNFETYLSNKVLLNLNAVYMDQMKASYYSFGGAMGYLVGDAKQSIINMGLWYWSDNAVIPYVGLAYGNMQFGFSYDLTVSKLNEAPKRPKTFELSAIIRGVRTPTKLIYCPWK